MIGYSRQQITAADIDAVIDVLKGDWLTQGPTIDLFEKKICEITGAKFAVAVSNATAALHLSLIACNVSNDDAIIVPTNTFVSTANVGIYCGASVEFCDTDPLTGNMCLSDFKDLYNDKIKVVIPVHFGGLPVDVNKINKMIDNSKTIIIEDASHALGAKYRDGSKVGSCRFSKCTVFSFHPVKIMTTGEGGIITTNDESLYRRLLRLRSHGINKLDDEFVTKEMAFEDETVNPWYYEMQELGYNYRLTDIQSALGVSQLSRLKENFGKRQKLASMYDQFFNNIANIKPLQKNNRHQNAHHLYPLKINFRKIGLSRAEVMTKLRLSDIGTQVHYIPVHLQPYYQKRFSTKLQKSFTGSDDYYRQTLSIPLFPDLTFDQIEFICQSIRSLVE